MADDRVNTPRRRSGISLRWLTLAAIPIAAIVCFVASDQARRRQRAAEMAQRFGGPVTLDKEYIPADPAARPLAPRSRRKIAPDQVASVDRESIENSKPTTSMIETLFGPRFAHSVSVINLNARPIADDDLSALAGLRDLKRLYLNATPITDAGLAYLSGLSGLERLELRESGIGDPGMAHLAGLTNLRELYLHESRVGDAGAASIATMTGLRELHLGRTLIGDAGVARLGALKGLRVLRLQQTRVGDAGLAALTGLGDLQELDLSGTAITDAGLAHLARLKSLRLLFLDDTRLSDDAVQALARALPGVRIFRSVTPIPDRLRRPGDSVKDRC